VIAGRLRTWRAGGPPRRSTPARPPSAAPPPPGRPRARWLVIALMMVKAAGQPAASPLTMASAAASMASPAWSAPPISAAVSAHGAGRRAAPMPCAIWLRAWSLSLSRSRGPRRHGPAVSVAHVGGRVCRQLATRRARQDGRLCHAHLDGAVGQHGTRVRGIAACGERAGDPGEAPASSRGSPIPRTAATAAAASPARPAAGGQSGQPPGRCPVWSRSPPWPLCRPSQLRERGGEVAGQVGNGGTSGIASVSSRRACLCRPASASCRATCTASRAPPRGHPSPAWPVPSASAASRSPAAACAKATAPHATGSRVPEACRRASRMMRRASLT